MQTSLKGPIYKKKLSIASGNGFVLSKWKEWAWTLQFITIQQGKSVNVL